VKTNATFDIKGSFKLNERGLVIYGDIVEGTISKKNSMSFKDGQKTINLKIASVDFLDKIQEKNFKIGLTFYYENDEQKEILQNLQVVRQMTVITNE